MYPNPQEALPLTPRPHLEQYRKLAKDLVKACRSGDATAIRRWAIRWVNRVATLQRRPKTLQTAADVETSAARIEEFSRKQFSGGKCSLTTAQFVIARAHGFASWPTFASHLQSLQDRTSTVTAFEAAVAAIVSGDADKLRRLMRAHPRLARARSTRASRDAAALRVGQRGRRLSATVAQKQRRDRRDPDRGWRRHRCDDGCLWRELHRIGLVATSGPPFAAGVQREVRTSSSSMAHGWICEGRSVTTRCSCRAASQTANRRQPNIWQAAERRSRGH